MGGVVNINSNPGLGSLSQYAPKACMNLTAKPTSGAMRLKWEDPEDYTTTDNYLVEWAYTRIVRKTGSYPVDENDGTVVVTSSTKNQYKNIAYTDSGLTNYTKYYYRAFSCSTDDVFNHEQVQVESTPIPWKVMTVNIDLNNSNPVTCGSYADDAVNMESGKTESAITKWKEFFKYKPCLFKDGKVIGYLNPNDYTKFEDGSSADIMTGNAGDVMIEFPRRGLRISKTNKILTVSMTDNPDDSDFKYYAHQRGTKQKDYFYLGAYLASTNNTNKVRSLSGMTVESDITFDTFVKYAKNNGTNYGIICFYQWVYIQAMYLLQFGGHLNSQAEMGSGPFGYHEKTGTLNTAGLFGIDKSAVKIFGVEDVWSNYTQALNNAYTPSGYLKTTTDDTITSTSKYDIDAGYFGKSSTPSSKFITDCYGTSEGGFVGIYSGYNGSSSTYFCDENQFAMDAYPLVGGYGYLGDSRGIFYFVSIVRGTYTTFSTRLQYL